MTPRDAPVKSVSVDSASGVLLSLTRDLGDVAPAVVDAHGGEPAAPDAAGVEAEQVGPVDEAERRPVAERDRNSCGPPPGSVEPGEVPRRRGGGTVLGRELERAVGRDEARPRQRVEGEAEAVVA